MLVALLTLPTDCRYAGESSLSAGNTSLSAGNQPVRWQPGSPLAIWAQGVQLGSLPATLTESTRLTGLPGPHTRSWAACNKSQPDISGGADRTPTDRLVSFWAQPGSAKQPEAPA